MESNKVLQYHNPAPQWEIFGIKDFESYRKNYVIKGAFHSTVTNEVRDAFEIAEYMMAHAYYHWALYDEALSKTLLILEMAVKQKCVDFGIPLTKKKRNGIDWDRRYSDLITDICKAEPLKNIEAGLNWLRERRNTRMHPSTVSFSGAIANYEAIRYAIGIINKLFIPEATLQLFQEQVIKVNNEIAAFFAGLFVLEIGKDKYLIEGITVEDAVFVGSEWIFYLVAKSISTDIEERIRKHNPINPQKLTAKGIKIEFEILQMTEAASQSPLKVYKTDNLKDINVYKKYQEDRDDAKDDLEGIQIITIKPVISIEHNSFNYCWLPLYSEQSI